MNTEDQTDIDKRQLHLSYILDLAAIRAQVKRSKSTPDVLKQQITNLELHIASELQEFLNG